MARKRKDQSKYFESRSYGDRHPPSASLQTQLCYEVRALLVNVRCCLETQQDSDSTAQSKRKVLKVAVRQTESAIEAADELFTSLFTAKQRRAGRKHVQWELAALRARSKALVSK